MFTWKFLLGNSLVILSATGLSVVHFLQHLNEFGIFQAATLVLFIAAFGFGLAIFASALRSSQKIARRLSLLSEMSLQTNRAILLNEDIDLIYGTILNYLFRIFDNVKFGSLLVLDDEGYLTFASARGFSEEYASSFRMKLEDSFIYRDTNGNIAGAQLISKKTLENSYERFRPGQWQYRSVISAPMYADKRLFGLLNLDSDKARAFAPEDVHIVEQFAAQIEVCLLARGRYRHHIERAHADSLTGLYTRRHFEDLFGLEVAKYERFGETFILAFFDADDLKKVNDSFGHQAGDRMLVAIADALRSGHRKTDILGRFGGDEFVAVYHASEMDSMAKNLAAVRDEVKADTVLFEGNRIPVSFSFGLARFPADGTTLEELIAVADRNLYAMKKGRKERGAPNGRTELPSRK